MQVSWTVMQWHSDTHIQNVNWNRKSWKWDFFELSNESYTRLTQLEIREINSGGWYICGKNLLAAFSVILHFYVGWWTSMFYVLWERWKEIAPITITVLHAFLSYMSIYIGKILPRYKFPLLFFFILDFIKGLRKLNHSIFEAQSLDICTCTCNDWIE